MGIRGPTSVAELTTIQGGRSSATHVRTRKQRKPRAIASAPIPSATPAPKHLTNATKQWWRSIISAYAIEEHQFRILLLAAESLDRREQARTALKKHGLTYCDDKGMIRARPEICIERDSSTQFLRCLRALRLESEAPL